MACTRAEGRWERYAWWAGVVFVIALSTDIAIAVTIPISHEDPPAKIAAGLRDHERQALAIAYASVVYAAAFVIYLWKLYRLLESGRDRARALASLVVLGGIPMIALHAVSDIGVTALLGAKLAGYSAQHDPGVSYSLYLLTFAIDSVGDVFGSLFMFAAGVLVLRTALLPAWQGWVAIVAAALFFLQGFGLGGIVATFGLVFDLIAFALFIVFVLASSVVMLRRQAAACG